MATFLGFRPHQLAYTNGERAFYASSKGVRRGFCAKCGTPMSYESDRFPDEVHIYLSTLDDPERYLPEFHVFFSERISWFDVVDELPRHRHTSFDPA